ncbi:MAG: hypothetical protein JKY43_03245 [Phycisphaerales bacterium]|nr:hypothetical protein [Phycisphaerales bacterium]
MIEQPKLYIVDFSIEITEFAAKRKIKSKSIRNFRSFPMLLINGHVPDKKYEQRIINNQKFKYKKVHKFTTVQKKIIDIRNVRFSSNINYKYFK